jgi:hypothetical protein
LLDEKVLKMALKNKGMQKLLAQMELASSYLVGFAQTYLGEYDEQGNQIEKGDRDVFYELLTDIKERLEKIEKEIEEIKEKIN